MTTTTLRTIADQLYTLLADRDGRQHMALAHGLNLVLEHYGDAWTLKLGRPGVYPADLEIAICRRAFDVRPTAVLAQLPPTDKGWHVITLRWTGPGRVARPATPATGAHP